MAIKMAPDHARKIGDANRLRWKEKQLEEFCDLLDSVSTDTLNHILGREIVDIINRMRSGEELLDGQRDLRRGIVAAFERARAG